jgi:hypothetical protein
MWNSDDDFVFTIWPEAAELDPAVYARLMATSNSLCWAYAPSTPDGTYPNDVPETWKLAEIFQARHLWSQASGGNRQEFGADGMAIPTYPLVFAARDLLRPASSPLGRLR